MSDKLEIATESMTEEPQILATVVRFELPPLGLPDLVISEGPEGEFTTGFGGICVVVSKQPGMTDGDVRAHLEHRLFEMLPSRVQYLESEFATMRQRIAELSGETQAEPERKWCSTVESDDEHVYGPYDTRDEALEGAWQNREDDGGTDATATLGRCKFADLGDFLDVGDLVERLEEIAIDNEWGWIESELFAQRESDSNAVALREIRQSLRRNYSSSFFMMMDVGRETVALAARSADAEE